MRKIKWEKIKEAKNKKIKHDLGKCKKDIQENKNIEKS